MNVARPSPLWYLFSFMRRLYSTTRSETTIASRMSYPSGWRANRARKIVGTPSTISFREVWNHAIALRGSVSSYSWMLNGSRVISPNEESTYCYLTCFVGFPSVLYSPPIEWNRAEEYKVDFRRMASPTWHERLTNRTIYRSFHWASYLVFSFLLCRIELCRDAGLFSSPPRWLHLCPLDE